MLRLSKPKLRRSNTTGTLAPVSISFLLPSPLKSTVSDRELNKTKWLVDPPISTFINTRTLVPVLTLPWKKDSKLRVRIKMTAPTGEELKVVIVTMDPRRTLVQDAITTIPN
jgi:hypothetical protein